MTEMMWCSARMWHPCKQGGGENCPKCVPPIENRCPERSYADHPCRVLGEHDVHRDGFGTSWWPVEETQP